MLTTSWFISFMQRLVSKAQRAFKVYTTFILSILTTSVTHCVFCQFHVKRVIKTMFIFITLVIIIIIIMPRYIILLWEQATLFLVIMTADT